MDTEIALQQTKYQEVFRKIADNLRALQKELYEHKNSIAICSDHLKILEGKVDKEVIQDHLELKETFNTFRDRLSNAISAVEKCELKMSQYSHSIEKLEERQDAFESVLDDIKSHVHEIKSIQQSLSQLYDKGRTNMDSINARFNKVETELLETANKVNNIYLSKRIVFAAASVVASLLAFFFAFKDHIVFK